MLLYLVTVSSILPRAKMSLVSFKISLSKVRLGYYPIYQNIPDKADNSGVSFRLVQYSLVIIPGEKIPRAEDPQGTGWAWVWGWDKDVEYNSETFQILTTVV